MRLLSLSPQHRTKITGRFSDGSDRQEIVESYWMARVLDDGGIEHRLEFPVRPTDQEILDLLDEGRPLIPSSRVGQERHMRAAYETWRMWHDTHEEAIARAAPAAVIAALFSRANIAWADYLAELQAWRAMP